MAWLYSSFTHIHAPGRAPEILSFFFFKDHVSLKKQKFQKKKTPHITLMAWRQGDKVLNTLVNMFPLFY